MIGEATRAPSRSGIHPKIQATAHSHHAVASPLLLPPPPHRPSTIILVSHYRTEKPSESRPPSWPPSSFFDQSPNTTINHHYHRYIFLHLFERHLLPIESACCRSEKTPKSNLPLLFHSLSTAIASYQSGRVSHLPPTLPLPLFIVVVVHLRLGEAY